MTTSTIREYTILFQYLLLLKEPLYIFLIQIFQHLAPVTWWEDFIQPVLQHEDKENFKYLDIADLLNVFKMNWKSIFRYFDPQYRSFKYDEEYKLVNRVHQIRTIVAHANDADMSPFIFVDSLSDLSDFASLIHAANGLPRKLQADTIKYRNQLPKTRPAAAKEDELKAAILSLIEDKVLLKAIDCETLKPDIKLSMDRTMMRFRSLRTLDEILGFFTNAQQSERGLVVQQELHKNKLLAFEDIREEVKRIYEASAATP